VQNALIQDRARKLAISAASDFAVSVYESKIRNGSQLDAFLASKNIAPKPLAPFTRDQGPAELGRSPEIAEEAFKLNNDHIVSDALPSPTGAVVLFFKNLEPSRKPAFAEVRDKVASDYVENEKRKRFVELGKQAKSQIEARIKAGDSFDKAVAAASNSTGLKFEVKTLPAFTLRTPAQGVDYSVLGALEQLNKGQVSDMVINPKDGVIVYAADKKVPDLSESNPQYVETRNQLATLSARIGASSAISEMVQRELSRTEPKQQ
jgi:peptidyl-prolyl cis-trans isomerase D